MLRNMRSAFAAAGHNWGITVTFPSSFWYLQHFDVKAIEQAVDWINMMTYVFLLVLLLAIFQDPDWTLT